MSNKRKVQKDITASLVGESAPTKTAGLIYTVAALAVFGVSFLLAFFLPPEEESPNWWRYLNFLAAPIAFLLVGVWYFSYTKKSLKELVLEQKCPAKYYLIAVLLQIGLFAMSELNGLFLEFLKKFGYTETEILLPSMEGIGFVGVLFTVAVLPAILEEFVFRGIFLKEAKEFSLLSKVLICGAFFALYHQNPAQTIYQFICGVAFALVAVKSGSFLPTALSHFVNNALILVLTKLGIESFTATAYIIILSVSAICLIVSLVYLLVFDRQKEEKKRGNYKQLFACASWGILIFFLSWFAMFFMGI